MANARVPSDRPRGLGPPHPCVTADRWRADAGRYTLWTRDGACGSHGARHAGAVSVVARSARLLRELRRAGRGVPHRKSDRLPRSRAVLARTVLVVAVWRSRERDLASVDLAPRTRPPSGSAAKGKV